jgi:hypothetical protein
MGRTSKGFLTLLIVILAASSLMMVGSSSAQSLPKPSIPIFTVQFVDNSYDIPTTHSFDPYTGQEITIQGTHVENKSIEVKIKNQPFETVYNQHGQAIDLYYNLRIKGHFEQNWTEVYRAVYGFPRQSTNSDYTVFSYTWVEQGETQIGTWMITLRVGAQADFQVEAMIGYIADSGPFSENFPREYFEGETSGWSNTQTITIPEGSTSTSTPTPSSSSNPTSMPTNSTVNSMTVPLSTLFAVVAVFLAIIVALSLLLFRKHRKAISQNKPNV